MTSGFLFCMLKVYISILYLFKKEKISQLQINSVFRKTGYSNDNYFYFFLVHLYWMYKYKIK
uniref:Small nuclear ribonucleoprotein f n=1 Tax=Triatoma infestans TaxID=30076 RepID=A0A161MP28_TRIIF